MSNKIVNNKVQTSASDAFSFPETWSSVEISVQVAWPLLALSTNKQTNILDLTAIKQLRKIAQSLHHKRLLSFLAHDFGFVSCCLQRDIDIVTAKQPSHFSSMKFLSAQNLEWVLPGLYSNFHSCKFGVDLTSPGDNTPLSNWFSSPGKSYEVSSGPNDEQPPLIKKR